MSTNSEQKDTLLDDRPTQLEAKPQPLSLEKRVDQIEATLLMIADVYRFQRLGELLAAGNWREADSETIRVILEITGQDELASITPDDVKQFPCNQLRVIDKLWTTYSQEHFGFSAQVQQYQSVGGVEAGRMALQGEAYIENFPSA